MNGALFLRSRADLEPWLTGEKRTLAGLWYAGTDLERMTGDSLAWALGWTLPVGFVRFPVTPAIRAASEPLVTRSAGGPLPDPSPGSRATGSGFLAVPVEVVELLAESVALPNLTVVGLIEADGRWRVLGPLGSRVGP